VKGDQVVSYHRLRTLAERHEITLASFVGYRHDVEAVAHLHTYCRHIETVRLPKPVSVANALVRFPSSRPLQVSYYAWWPFRRMVTQLLAKRRFDVVHGFLVRMAPYLETARTPSVLDAIDSMQLKLGRDIERTTLARRLVFREELRRMRSFEPSVARSNGALIVTTQADADAFGGGNIHVIPNGVDVGAFSPDSRRRSRETVVFSGNLAYEPNEVAATWFVQECLPLIRAAVPSISALICGRNPSRRVRALGRHGGVDVLGDVASMPDALNRASVAVAPMLTGSGMQNKILEAMACELPVVTTSLGRGDIGAGVGDGLLVSDSAERFASTVVDLIRRPEWAEDIGRRGRRYVERFHSWERGAREVEAIYEAVSAQ
jgi:sugar transferase (PEP-CTERM/EpsH1 system associated)